MSLTYRFYGVVFPPVVKQVRKITTMSLSECDTPETAFEINYTMLLRLMYAPFSNLRPLSTPRRYIKFVVNTPDVGLYYFKHVMYLNI